MVLVAALVIGCTVFPMSSPKDQDEVLETLRRQYDDLTRDVDAARTRLGQLEWKLDNLRDAIDALERMQSPALTITNTSPVTAGGISITDSASFKLTGLKTALTGGATGGISAALPGLSVSLGGSKSSAANQPKLRTPTTTRVWGMEEPLELTTNFDWEKNIHPALAPYVGGTGQRLRSTAMVADLLASTDESFTRDELKTLFFVAYPREELEKYWEKPDNAFGNALLRAVDEGLVFKGKRNGNTEIFIGRNAYDKMRDDSRKKKES